MYARVYWYFPTAVRDWVDWEGHHGKLHSFIGYNWFRLRKTLTHEGQKEYDQ